MIKVNVQDKDAQLVVLNTLYPDSGIKVRIEGELELYDITDMWKKRGVKKKLRMFKRVRGMGHLQKMFMAFWKKT